MMLTLRPMERRGERRLQARHDYRGSMILMEACINNVSTLAIACRGWVNILYWSMKCHFDCFRSLYSEAVPLTFHVLLCSVRVRCAWTSRMGHRFCVLEPLGL